MLSSFSAKFQMRETSKHPQRADGKWLWSARWSGWKYALRCIVTITKREVAKVTSLVRLIHSVLNLLHCGFHYNATPNSICRSRRNDDLQIATEVSRWPNVCSSSKYRHDVVNTRLPRDFRGRARQGKVVCPQGRRADGEKQIAADIAQGSDATQMLRAQGTPGSVPSMVFTSWCKRFCGN